MDIDLNYVGALDLAARERERPEVDAAIDRLFASHGDGVRHRPTGHAGGKWLARYAFALGGNASLELDLNYMARQPLFGAVRMESRILGRVGTGRVLVLDLHEIVAGKIVALFDRGAARNLFDGEGARPADGALGATAHAPAKRYTMPNGRRPEPLHRKESPMTAQTLPDNSNHCFFPAYDVEDEVQQIRIVIAEMAGYVPTTLVALTVEDADNICDKLNRRLGVDREAWDHHGSRLSAPRR